MILGFRTNRSAWANSTEPDQTAPEGQSDKVLPNEVLHCLPFCFHHFEACNPREGLE